MPALRRFLANIFPVCFGSAFSNSNYDKYRSPNEPNKLSDPKPKNSEGTLSFSKSTFGGTGITKTLETRVESRGGSEDGILLVDVNQETASKTGWNGNETDAGSERSGVPQTQDTHDTLRS